MVFSLEEFDEHELFRSDTLYTAAVRSFPRSVGREIEIACQSVIEMTETINARINGLLRLKFQTNLPPGRPRAKSATSRTENSV
jgi:hypothetical protein